MRQRKQVRARHLRRGLLILGLILATSAGPLFLRRYEFEIEQRYLFVAVTIVIGWYMTLYFGRGKVWRILTSALISSSASTLVLWGSFVLLESLTSMDAARTQALTTLPSALVSFYLGIPVALVSSLLVTIDDYLSARAERLTS